MSDTVTRLFVKGIFAIGVHKSASHDLILRNELPLRRESHKKDISSPLLNRSSFFFSYLNRISAQII